MAKSLPNGDICYCRNFYVCDEHFLDNDYVNHRKQRLNYNAVPSASNKSTNEKTADHFEAVLDVQSSSTGLDNQPSVLQDITNSSKPSTTTTASNSNQQLF